MEKQITSIIVITLMILACIRWWYITKDVIVRKYILLTGICIIITVVFYLTGVSYDIISLRIISGFVFLGGIYFIIKAMLVEHRVKKKEFHN
jgi:hypothetical protein